MDTQKKTASYILIEQTQELVESLGKEDEIAIMTPDHIRLEIKYDIPKESYLIFQLIKGFISSLATEHPTVAHRDIVFAAIKIIDSTLLDDTGLLDKMARQLVIYCNKLDIDLKAPKKMRELAIDREEHQDQFSPDSGRVPPYFKLFKVNNSSELEHLFEKDDMFIWDNIFLSILRKTGKEGNKFADQNISNCRIRLRDFKSSGKNPLLFWFNFGPQGPFHLSNALQILSKCIFEDLIRSANDFKEKNVPALTTTVEPKLLQMLSPKTSLNQSNTEIQLHNQTHMIGSVQIPMINPGIISNVLRGIYEFRSLTAQRLLRLYIQSSFEQVAGGIRDYRILKYDGGDKEIAEILGLKSNNEITRIKNINYALSHFEFTGANFTSRLISSGTYKSPITHRNDGREITVLSPLLPFRIFEDGGLLLPLLKEPPFVSRPNSWSGQLLLHWMIIEEFGKQSMQLARDGYIHIPQHIWEERAYMCDLNKDVLSKVQDRWTQDGTDGAKFLEKIDRSFYTLGEEHKKELIFLKEQGFLRMRQSKRGCSSASKRSLKVNHSK